MIIVALIIIVAFLYAINRKLQPAMTWQERHKRLKRNVLICAAIVTLYYAIDLARFYYP